MRDFQAFILFFSVIAFIALLCIIFWIWTIVDVAKRNFSNGNERLIWLLLIVLLGIIPSIIYYILVMRPKNKGIIKPDKSVKKK